MFCFSNTAGKTSARCWKRWFSPLNSWNIKNDRNFRKRFQKKINLNFIVSLPKYCQSHPVYQINHPRHKLTVRTIGKAQLPKIYCSFFLCLLFIGAFVFGCLSMCVCLFVGVCMWLWIFVMCLLSVCLNRIRIERIFLRELIHLDVRHK